MKETIETRRRDGIEAASRSVLRNSGKEMMDRIRSITTEMREKESALLEARLNRLHWAEGLMLSVAAIGIALSLVGRFLTALVQVRTNPP